MKTLKDLKSRKTIRLSEIVINSNFDEIDVKATELLHKIGGGKFLLSFELDYEHRTIFVSPRCSAVSKAKQTYVCISKLVSYFELRKQLVPVLDVEIGDGFVSELYVKFHNVLNYL